MMKFRRNGSVIRWPFAIPQPSGRHPSSQIEVGNGSYLGRGAWFNLNSPEARVRIGDDTLIARDLTITCGRLVDIGSGVWIGERTAIFDQHHEFRSWHAEAAKTGQAPTRNWDMGDPEPVTISDGAWLGVNVVVMPGVTIGKGAVVGASAVVTTDIPDFALALGIPAQVVGTTADA